VLPPVETGSLYHSEVSRLSETVRSLIAAKLA